MALLSSPFVKREKHFSRIITPPLISGKVNAARTLGGVCLKVRSSPSAFDFNGRHLIIEVVLSSMQIYSSTEP